MASAWQLAFYSVLIVAASMAGGLAPAMMRFSHRQLHLLMSFVAGLMLGVAVFHLWPHSAEQLKSVHSSASWLMVGLLGMFFLIRAFHFHQHASLEPDEANAPGSNAEGEHSGCLVHDHDHGHGHDHDHDHDHSGHSPATAHTLSWAGIGFGLTIHTLIDGMALAASVQAGIVPGQPLQRFVGVGTFVAIALHKPLDAMSITALMASGGWSQRARFWVNLAFAAICPIGVMLFFVLDRSLASQAMLLGASLAFSAGVFLCISLSDLLPEIQFHHHDRVKLSLALLAGVGLAWLLQFVEPVLPHQHARITEGSYHSTLGDSSCPAILRST